MARDLQPRLGVAVLLHDAHGRYLLGQRGRGPNAGKWVIPGGGIELGETWHEAGRRELLEETGLTVGMSELRPYIMEIIGRGSHRVCLVVEGVVLDGEIRPSAELPAVRWFTRDELQAMAESSEISEPVVDALEWFGLVY